LRGSTCSHRDWLIAISERDKLRHQWRHVFSDFDVILCPVMPTTAFVHDHSDFLKRQIEVDGQLLPYGDQFIWSSMATLFGLPATVMPIALAENGLPVGMQIIGDYLEDYTTLKFAELAEREFGNIKYSGLD
jgi:amidase